MNRRIAELYFRPSEKSGLRSSSRPPSSSSSTSSRVLAFHSRPDPNLLLSPLSEHGFEKTLFPPAVNSTDSSYHNDKYSAKVPKAGNTLAVQLVIDGMKLQPCRPTFQDARDAIIAADKALTGGDNLCILWKGFASRGLGPDSKVRPCSSPLLMKPELTSSTWSGRRIYSLGWRSPYG